MILLDDPVTPGDAPFVRQRDEWAEVPHEQVVLLDGDGRRTPFTGAWPRRDAWVHLWVGDQPWVVGLEDGSEGTTGAWSGPGEGEVLLVTRGAAVLLAFEATGAGSPEQAHVSATVVPLDVTAVHPDPPTRSLLVLSSTAAGAWRDGGVAWVRRDLAVGGTHLVLLADGVAVVRVHTGYPDQWHEVALSMTDGSVVAGPWRCTELL